MEMPRFTSAPICSKKATQNKTPLNRGTAAIIPFCVSHDEVFTHPIVWRMTPTTAAGTVDNGAER